MTPEQLDAMCAAALARSMNTAHRSAARQKREILPKWLRRKLDGDQIVSCKVAHLDLISRFTNGTATEHDMWDMLHTALTYSEMMRLLEESGIVFTDEAKAAVVEHLESMPGVIDRYRKTGRVGFNGEQLLAARAASMVTEQLIEMDRFGIALRASEWAKVKTEQARSAT
jgi:hypothetical protein